MSKQPQKIKQESPKFESPLQQFINKTCKANACLQRQNGFCNPYSKAGRSGMQLCLDAAILAAFNEPIPATDPKQIVREGLELISQMGCYVEEPLTPDEHKPREGLGVKRE